jgi:Tol biopolymer transport system component
MYLYISSINADTVQTFLSYDGVLSSLQWSPDPNILAVNQTHQGLILYDVSTKTGLDTFSVWAGSTFDYPSYELSPDGRKIIYTHRWYDANPDAIIPTELYCIDIRSSQTKLVASAYPGIESYSWHPSSKEVFYGFNGKIYKVRVE